MQLAVPVMSGYNWMHLSIHTHGYEFMIIYIIYIYITVYRKGLYQMTKVFSKLMEATQITFAPEVGHGSQWRSGLVAPW